MTNTTNTTTPSWYARGEPLKPKTASLVPEHAQVSYLYHQPRVRNRLHWGVVIPTTAMLLLGDSADHVAWTATRTASYLSAALRPGAPGQPENGRAAGRERMG